ncbi:hypothetical protein F4780DRAFT_761622 [Xylariomycetidae sp. FL0641]|nr:hypothetical protein F4780DRAFT_761622 [Xylariomycetidae sp. FL0641]
MDIKRKPVPSPQRSPQPKPYDPYDDLLEDYLDQPPSYSLEPPADKETKVKDNVPVTETRALTVESRPPLAPRHLTIPVAASQASPSELSVRSAPTTPEAGAEPAKSIWKTALDETVYFAGGLVSHPFESTKRFSILRHSGGLIFYKGPATSVKLSVFSDAPLPPDRSFWLQRRGVSGNLGMAASALLGTTGSWIDVTPSSEAFVSEIPEKKERVWQRDIEQFTKKAAKDKRLAKQVVRETCVIRVPASAADGYLRVVMCTGGSSKKTLCPSPVFRIASTSSDVSVMRGASLATMPIEAGLKVASIVGNQYVQRFIGPAQAVVETASNRLQPGFMKKEVGKFAVAKVTAKEKFDSLEANFDAARDVQYGAFHDASTLEAPPDVLGTDAGPEKPFPISFDGRVVQGTGQALAQTGVPTANLAGVSDDLLLRLNGIYIGWVAVQPKNGLHDVSYDWHEALITFGPSPYAAPTVVAKTTASVHIIHDFGAATFVGAKLRVLIMALLRPVPKVDRSGPPVDVAAAVARDTDIAVASLSREHWQCEMSAQRIQTERSQMTVADRYVEARAQVQKRVDSVPLHLMGVRTEVAEIKDQHHGRGGMYIRR